MNIIIEHGHGQEYKRISLKTSPHICMFLEFAVYEEQFGEYVDVNKAIYLDNTQENILEYIEKIVENKKFIIKGGHLLIPNDDNIESIFKDLIGNTFTILIDNIELEKCTVINNALCIEIVFEDFYKSNI